MGNNSSGSNQLDINHSRQGLPSIRYRDPSLTYINDAWSRLPPHIREAVMTLTDSGLRVVSKGTGDEL